MCLYVCVCVNTLSTWLITVGLVILLCAFRVPHGWPFISCGLSFCFWIPWAQTICGRMTNRSVNNHSSYQIWPLFLFLPKLTHGDPQVSQTPTEGYWGTLLWALSYSLEWSSTPKKLQAPSVVLTFSWDTWMSHHGKNLKIKFLHDFLNFLSQNRRTFLLLLKSLPAWKNVFLYVKLPPEPRWKSEPKHS